MLELDKLGHKMDASMRKYLGDAYTKNYTDTAKDYLKIGQGPVNVKVDPKRIEDVLRNPWSGKSYSQRIWGNLDRLGSSLQTEITTGIHRGESIDKMAKRIAERMEVSKSAAVRLIRTEMSYVNNPSSTRLHQRRKDEILPIHCDH